jgi:hypothetical protein
MNTVLIILAVLYGLTSLFILLASIIFARVTNYPKNNRKKTTITRISAYVCLFIMSILPILRWLLLLGAYYNYTTYGEKVD